MLLNETEMADSDFSVQELKKQLFTSLQCTGILDSLKSQLRARLLDHLREQDGSLLENKDRKPSVTERLLSSLFLDYLNSYGYAFTQSVFLPESRMVSWPPYTYQEILQLLHLDSSSAFDQRLKIAPDGRSCLMQQLVMALQKFSFHINTHDASVQTQDLDSCLREIDDECCQRQDAERRLAFCSLEDRLTGFRQEFGTRVNGEVAMQFNRVRAYETNALRMEEACRYRRQLAKDREELEELHKARLERIHEREESLMGRLLVKEKALETAAYEQRQKLLADITSVHDREEMFQEREQLQVRREEKLAEQEKYLKLREEDICHMRETLYARVDESAAVKIKELEDQYRIKSEQLQSDRSLLEAKWEAFHEGKARLSNELREAKVDKELVISMHERLASEGEQRQLLLDQIENVHQICQQQKQKSAHEQKKMQKAISKLEADLNRAVDEKDGVIRSRKALQVQLRHSESELLDTVTLLKKTQHALELERLHHYSLRSQIATYFSCGSQDKLQERQEDASLADRQAVELKEAILRNNFESGDVERPSRAVNSLDEETGNSSTESVKHNLSSSQVVTPTKLYSPNAAWPVTQKSRLAQEAKTASNPFPRGTVLEVRVHQDHSRTSDGARRASVYSPPGERGESSGTDISSSSSKNQQVNLSGIRRGGYTSEYSKERADKDCFDPTSIQTISLTCTKSVGGAQISSLPISRKQSQTAKQKTASAVAWEPTESSTNYYMMGATSLKTSNSLLEFEMMGKAVKLSTSVDHDHNERRHAEVYETKFQQNIQKRRADPHSDRQSWTQVDPGIPQQYAYLVRRSQGSEQRCKSIYEHSVASEDTFSPDSSGAKCKHREPKEVIPQIQKRRPHGRSFERRDQRDREYISQGEGSPEQQKLATSVDVGTELKPEKVLARLERSRASEPSRVPSPDNIDHEINAHGLSAMVLEDLKRFSQQLEVTKNLMDTGKPYHTASAELGIGNKLRSPRTDKSNCSEQQVNARNGEETGVTSVRQLLVETDLLESASQKHESTVPANQKGNVFEHPSLSSGHSSSKYLTLQDVADRKSTQKTITGGANSEESCSKPILRTPIVKTTPEISNIRQIDPEANENLQDGADTAKQVTQKWEEQSEQGSHNPEEETMEWVDDYATGDTDQYVEYSDAFSVPESTNTPSNGSTTAGYS